MVPFRTATCQPLLSLSPLSCDIYKHSLLLNESTHNIVLHNVALSWQFDRIPEVLQVVFPELKRQPPALLSVRIF